MVEQEIGRVIPRKHSYRVALNWETWVQCCYNYERMMGMACGHAFVPVIDDLYKDDPGGAAKRREVMEREMELFDAHTEFGPCTSEMAITLEGQKPLGELIPGEFITFLEISLMGPPAGIENTIYQGVLVPILPAIRIDITLAGTVWGAIVYLTLMLAISYIFNFASFFFGYQQGSEAIMDLLKKGLLGKLLLGVQVMGYMVMGGLIANYVETSCGSELITSGSKFNVQTQLPDTVTSDILSFGFMILVYWLMKKRWTSTKIIILIVNIGITGRLTGILAQQPT